MNHISMSCKCLFKKIYTIYGQTPKRKDRIIVLFVYSLMTSQTENAFL